MSFIKGMVIGTCISAGVYMLYAETSKGDAKKLMKKGKKFIKSMGSF